MVPERPPLEIASAVNKVFMMVLSAQSRRLLKAPAKPLNDSVVNVAIEPQ
jgi:hypothetical protein